jgi:hypothetical protein
VIARCPLYPPKADIVQHGREVRFVPKADIAAYLKKLIGCGEER